MRLTPQQRERYNKAIAQNSAICKVPFEFQLKQAQPYPPDNTHEFERWFYDTTPYTQLAGKERVYLPIFWTAYYCNHGYGSKTGANKRLQHFIDQLPRNKKYWTICQYDDGCMVDFKDLDIKIFGMSGGRIDYPIPLLCMPHKYVFPNIQKDILCSFVGTDTHPVRRELVKEFSGKKNCVVKIGKISMEEYCKTMARSVFSLCPRGYGKSSFRIQEAVQQDSIPVYISDVFINPYNDDSLIPARILNESIAGLHDYLKSIEHPYGNRNMDKIKHLFTYEGCKQKILENI